MSDDFLEELGRVESKTKRPAVRPSPTQKQLANPLDAIPAGEVRRVTNAGGRDPSMVGQQLRRSILIPPEMDEEIDRICRRYKVKKMEMLRFLIAKGLEEVHKGALEGNLVQKVVLELPQPAWKSR